MIYTIYMVIFFSGIASVVVVEEISITILGHGYHDLNVEYLKSNWRQIDSPHHVFFMPIYDLDQLPFVK